MFCAAVSDGSRLNDWNTNPTRWRRKRASRRSPMPVSSVPPIRTEPRSGRSRPAAHCSSVVLPDPEGPMIAVNVPGSKPSEMSSSARTVPSPRPWVLVTPVSDTAGALACRAVIDMRSG